MHFFIAKEYILLLTMVEKHIFSRTVVVMFEKFLLQIIAFDELKTDFKSPIDQCNPAHAVSAII